MKKKLLLLLALLGLTASYFAAVHLSGGAFPAPAFLKLGGDKEKLRSISMKFMEDIEFKDYQNAASYHHPELQSTVDIPFLIHRLFKVKPEAMDIMEYEPVFAKLDSSKLRGRVKMRVKVKLLAQENIITRELMLFYSRDTPTSPWYMILEDSLRNPESDKMKKS
ncbi:hypothetical protein [Rubritalea tangerina]|uniref:DUF4864 domain-containing protein n=1 Tax=Rubritalea tangerina TaxID=430798 RepID=A0ABW4ZBP8_9BACT